MILVVLRVKIYRTNWTKKKEKEEPDLYFLDEVTVDLEKMCVISNTARDKGLKNTNILNSSAFRWVETYEEFLDALVEYQDREYMNSRHIVDKFKETGFYDFDYWMQKLNKIEFSYEYRKLV